MRLLSRAPAALLLLVLLAPTVPAQDGPVPVRVGMLVINLGNYDVNKGTYTIDLYLWFRWTPAEAPEGFTPERFEFMNGRASAKERIFDETDPATGEREVWYRVQANLYSDPQFADYPYDTQTIHVLLEDAVGTTEELVYEPLDDESGVDEDLRIAGWRIESAGLTTDEKTYRFEETYSRLAFTMVVSREPTSTTLKAFLPPFAFMFVSGLSFFFHPSKVAQRLTLGTSMLISAVLFHISQTVALPPLAQLILFDKIMFSVYAFLAGSLIVTTLIAVDEDFWKDRDHTRRINVWGGIATVVLPFVVYALLAAL